VDELEKEQEEKIKALAEARAKELADEQLKDIKSKLDSAYAQRDAAQKLADKAKAEEAEREAKRLEAEGKNKEAFELRLKEAQEAQERLLEQNTKLTRDVTLKDALRSLDFHSANASTLAFGVLSNQLVRNEKGDWVGPGGEDVNTLVKTFSENPDNEFLFKAKTSTGPGLPSNPGKPTTPVKKLSELSQEEVLKLAAEGKLPSRRRTR
jgi:ATPase subunit of ABC transporter with duplicated ATPase domains